MSDLRENLKNYETKKNSNCKPKDYEWGPLTPEEIDRIKAFCKKVNEYKGKEIEEILLVILFPRIIKKLGICSEDLLSNPEAIKTLKEEFGRIMQISGILSDTVNRWIVKKDIWLNELEMNKLLLALELPKEQNEQINGRNDNTYQKQEQYG